MKENQKQDARGLWFLLIGAVCALLCFAVTAGVLLLSDVSPLIPTVVGGVILCGMETAVAFLYIRTAKPEEKADRESDKISATDVLRYLSEPVVFTEADGNIRWPNVRLQNLMAENGYRGKNLSEIIDVPMADITKADTEAGCDVRLFGTVYRVHSYLTVYQNTDYWMLFFDDRTEELSLQAAIGRESPVIVYAVLDNIDKITQFVRTSSRETSNRIEQILTAWATGLDGFIREYDRDKYMIQFPKNRLDECIETGFSVLNDIRAATDPASGVPLTVSMGVSACGDNVREREADAAAALETALQRGGDQVVLREKGGRFAYFGGTTKTDISHTRIATRTAGGKIAELIRNAGNVLIMGHSRPDFDSIGACIGLYRLAQAYAENVFVVVDRNDPNFFSCTEDLLREQPEYDRVFISGEEGMELIRSDTLLLVADVNNMKIVECPDIVRNVATQVVIDHHRKVEEFEVQPVISIIEPGTSSASELVSEILEFSAASGVEMAERIFPTAEEANVLLSGMMLDTKNFSRCTGEETYAAAMFLRNHGADSEKVRTFFASDERSYVAEARLSANARRFMDRVLITGEKIPEGSDTITAQDRIVASRVAESLLTLKNTDAAFTMFYSDTDVLISGRSNGEINVQLILEALGGGGRYDAAGAQVHGSSYKQVSEKLKDVITTYLTTGDVTKKAAKPAEAAPAEKTAEPEKAG